MLTQFCHNIGCICSVWGALVHCQSDIKGFQEYLRTSHHAVVFGAWCSHFYPKWWIPFIKTSSGTIWWWSIWIFFVLCKFVWTEGVYAITHLATIGTTSYLLLLEKSNLYLPTEKIPFSKLKSKILDPKILFEDPEHILLATWSVLVPYYPHHLGKCNSYLR